jgi:hypothetical protein
MLVFQNSGNRKLSDYIFDDNTDLCQLRYKAEGRGGTVEALRLQPEGWDFSLTESFRPHYGPVDDAAMCVSYG